MSGHCARTGIPTSDQIAAFLAVMRSGNTLAAARQLKVDHSTVSRRLDSLEAKLGVRLFDRSPRGFTPTAAGERLLPEAERVESALFAVAASVSGSASEVAGTVRLATPEIFGTTLVAPHLSQLTARHPRLTLELEPESRSISLTKREAELAVMVRRPPRGRLIVRQLADYRIGLYAAADYLDRCDPIRSAADLSRQGFVSFIDELAAFPELVALDEVLPGARVVFRSTASGAQQAAVRAGVGLGPLHCLVADDDPALVRVLPEAIEVRRSYWLVVHSDLHRLPAVRAIIDFVAEQVRSHRDAL